VGVKIVDISVDVTGKAAIEGRLHTQVTVHLPDRAVVTRPPIVLFAFPGGGAARGMYCMEAPTTMAYSQAQWHAERGFIFVSCDHLGTGQSSHPDPSLLSSPYPLAWTNQATVTEVLRLLTADEVVPGYGPVERPVILGMGHSMGANLTIVLQAHRQVFDGVAILGYSAIHTALPVPPGFDPLPPRRPPRLYPPDGRSLAIPEDNARALRRYMSRWDDAEAAEIRKHHWVRPVASRTMPPAARFMNAAGVVAEEASWIECPVFLGFGERDVTRNAWEEPRYYWRARDVTLAVIPRMSHGLNSAATREMMWRRLHAWATMVVDLVSAEKDESWRRPPD
jgi:pimeloyl-ACP methyl ester carboxylesterase